MHNYDRFLPENHRKTPALDFLKLRVQKVLVSAAFFSEWERVFQAETIRIVLKILEAELLSANRYIL